MVEEPQVAAKAASVSTTRPTKKQRVLLDFIEQFIEEHGYSPSYREIVNGCGYSSIATVAVHINNLISRGHLRKRDHSARSLELTDSAGRSENTKNKDAMHEAWLSVKVDALFDRMENNESEDMDDEVLQSIVTTFDVLGLEAAADQLAKRLDSLSQPAE